MIRRDVYDKIKKVIYDDSQWSEGVMDALANQMFEDADTAGPIE